MVRLIPSHVFVKDPVDVWNKEPSVGPAEIAVRTWAPPLTFDKRGSVIRWLDFESSTPNYAIVKAGTPTYCDRSNTIANNGDFSYLIDGDNSNYATISMHTDDFHIGNMGNNVMFASTGTDYYITSSIYYYDGSNFHAAELKYDRNAEKLYYMDSSGVYVEIAALTCLNHRNSFSTLKVVADFNNAKYVRAMCFGNEYDLSAHSLYTSGSAIVKHIKAFSMVRGITAGGMQVYIDNMVLTENEPT